MSDDDRYRAAQDATASAINRAWALVTLWGIAVIALVSAFLIWMSAHDLLGSSDTVIAPERLPIAASALQIGIGAALAALAAHAVIGALGPRR